MSVGKNKMSNWDDIKFALALAKDKSMSEAAKRLNTNVATVSRRVSRLEQTFGSPAFVKLNNEWVLTEEGEDLVKLASEFDAGMYKIQDRYSSVDTRDISVRISAVGYIIENFMSKMTVKLAKEFPNISVTYEASDKRVSLAYGEADIAIRLSRPTEGRLIGKKIGAVSLATFSRSGRVEVDWVGLPKDLDWLPEMQLAFSKFKKEPKIRTATYESIASIAQLGNFNGIAPLQVIQNHRDLIVHEYTGAKIDREVWLVYHETRRNDPVIHILTEIFSNFPKDIP
jgi:DNA-binding transcriptional LysR family regulator